MTTNQHILLPSVYAGNLEYFRLLKNSNAVTIEMFEHYIKQTYRSRCTIYGANGKLDLIVPVEKGKTGHRPMKDVKISYGEKWQRLHWKSLESAYRTSPYFEFYEHELQPFYEKKFDYLVDLNWQMQETIMRLAEIETPLTTTSVYQPVPEGCEDQRGIANPQKEMTGTFEPYTQVFGTKMGFIPNLTILDLLFNCGPHSGQYL